MCHVDINFLQFSPWIKLIRKLQSSHLGFKPLVINRFRTFVGPISLSDIIWPKGSLPFMSALMSKLTSTSYYISNLSDSGGYNNLNHVFDISLGNIQMASPFRSTSSFSRKTRSFLLSGFSRLIRWHEYQLYPFTIFSLNFYWSLRKQFTHHFTMVFFI